MDNAAAAAIQETLNANTAILHEHVDEVVARTTAILHKHVDEVVARNTAILHEHVDEVVARNTAAYTARMGEMEAENTARMAEVEAANTARMAEVEAENTEVTAQLATANQTIQELQGALDIISVNYKVREMKRMADDRSTAKTTARKLASAAFLTTVEKAYNEHGGAAAFQAFQAAADQVSSKDIFISRMNRRIH